MLRPDELRDLARKKPFRPFRIHVSDHSFYDVVRTDMILIGERSVVIGIPGRKDGICSRTVMVDLAEIIRIDTEPAPAVSP